jgi:hypothetical protein
MKKADIAAIICVQKEHQMNIQIPVEIITPRIAFNKQDSFFYAGKNIAKVVVGNREYVLTTSGTYAFSLKEGGETIAFDARDRHIGAGCPGGQRAHAYRTLTDAKIEKLGAMDKDLITNWGWFGINVWVDGKFQDASDSVWSEYDEALKAFKTFITNDVAKGR